MGVVGLARKIKEIWRAVNEAEQQILYLQNVI